MQSFTRRDGYTLMEMLVVIAIIGVLAGLIFPVAATAKARARQAQCMNNMYQIFTALKQFQLDEKRYPEFIAGPVQWKDSQGKYSYQYNSAPGVPLNENTGMVGGTNGGNGRAVALYPEYISGIGPLKCPDTSINGETNQAERQYRLVTTAEVDGVTVVYIVQDPMYPRLSAFPAGRVPWRGKGLEAIGPNFGKGAFWLYKYSSYDYQKPPGPGVDEVHYSPAWADFDPNVPLRDQADVQRQLRWRTPPEDTVVTWCSHHRRVDGAGNPVSGSKDIVLFLDGHTKVMASQDLEPWYGPPAPAPPTGWRVPRGS